MKTFYILLAIIGILLYNVFLIHRDSKLFEAYNACAHYTDHPNCPYDKK